MDGYASSPAAGGRSAAPNCRDPVEQRERAPARVLRAAGGLAPQRLGVGHRVALRQPLLDDLRRDLGVVLQTDTAPDRERLRARGSARKLDGTRRQGEGVLVPGEPTAAVAVVAVHVDPADL